MVIANVSLNAETAVRNSAKLVLDMSSQGK